MFCRSLFVHFLLITSLESFGHCIVCPSSIYRFDYPLVSFGHCIFCPSSIYRFDHPFCIFWPLYFLSIFNWPFWLPLCYHLATLLSVHLQFTILITPLVSFGHSVDCPSSIYSFDYLFGIVWLLYYLSIFNLPLWLPRWYLLAIALSVHLQFTVWLPLWYFLATLLSVHLQFTVLITPLVSSNFSSYARACSLYSKCLQRHHILSNKLLNRWFLKNRFIFQNVLQKISTPCWKAFCQLCTGDENGIVNYILI
jgi:hypothetical protein